jgi:hypothetical protein
MGFALLQTISKYATYLYPDDGSCSEIPSRVCEVGLFWRIAMSLRGSFFTFTLLLAAGPAVAQLPNSPPPRELPRSIAQPSPADEIRLPREEVWERLNPATVRVIRAGGTWQLYADGKPFRDFGDSAENAAEAAKLLREMHATHWTTIGTSRPVVEYGLTDGKVAASPASARPSLPIDLRTVRAELIRGVWCLRDNTNILLNFGQHKEDAEQAVAVCRKYGFNRIGIVGRSAPALTYFYAHSEIELPPTNSLPAAIQEQALTRTGIEVPGLGYVGEKIAIDSRKVEARRDKGEWVVAAGSEILARFSGNEWAARDAAKVVREGRFNEFCRFGTAGVTFFLVNGQAPTRVPFFAQTTRFDPQQLQVREIAGKWWLFDTNGRQLLPAGSETEAEQLVKLIQAYGFDQLCQVGTSPAASMKFLGKGR